ncbi:MAG: HTH-type transcriptional regulator, sugar sensing transcriptional regulator [Eubacteriaceae bacterium]|jgi:sugar-specific transcriptional regulator TrmB|nr:HTH-type transcriptional regulator, sugar sensing transcriptional regulator [Eubacteriaceae bacterium]MDK2905470.1 HTH-type transcriptional regulator, sugar sensing transcriptional regulator [Eubacteriaceae bacterium]
MDPIEQLMQFGLTRHEAAIYLALLGNEPLNGYEVAKLTGIARSNAYSSLSSLVEKGGAYTIEESAIKYCPVPIKDFCQNKILKLQKIEDSLIRNIPPKTDYSEGYITIKGENNIMDKLRNMIAVAKERIYLSVSDCILDLLRSEITTAINRNIKVVLITNQNPNLEGAIIYISNEPLNQIRLIADSTNVLTGDLNSGDQSTCLYSKKKNLIDLFKDSMKNEIKLIEIMKGN